VATGILLFDFELFIGALRQKRKGLASIVKNVGVIAGFGNP
jgi:hypothetical protein